MLPVSTAHLVGLGGVSLSFAATVLQYRRARRLGTDGISLTTWYQFILLSFFWISYGLAVHSRIVIAGSLLCVPVQLAIVARLAPWRNLEVVARATTFIFACCVIPTFFAGWSAGAIGAGVAMAANRLPQVIELIRHPGDLGVSASSWFVGAACSVLWIGYYTIDHLLAALIATVAGMLGNIAIAVLATWRHRQSVERVEAPVLVRPLAS